MLHYSVQSPFAFSWPSKKNAVANYLITRSEIPTPSKMWFWWLQECRSIRSVLHPRTTSGGQLNANRLYIVDWLGVLAHAVPARRCTKRSQATPTAASFIRGSWKYGTRQPRASGCRTYKFRLGEGSRVAETVCSHNCIACFCSKFVFCQCFV